MHVACIARLPGTRLGVEGALTGAVRCDGGGARLLGYGANGVGGKATESGAGTSGAAHHEAVADGVGRLGKR